MSWRRVAVGALGAALLLRCSSFSAPGGATPSDAGADTFVEPDAGPRCTPGAPFGTPAAVMGIPGALHGLLRLTADESTGYYVNEQGTLFFAPRLSATEFGTGVAAAVLDAADALRPIDNASLSDDRKTLFYSKDFHVYRATGAQGGPYGKPVEVSADFLIDPFYDAPHQTLYAARYTDQSQHRELVRASAGGGTPFVFETVDRGPSSNHSPVPARDGITLFFGSDRSLGFQEDVFVTSLAKNPSDGGAAAEAVSPVNSIAIDVPSWISADGCYMYLASNRQSALGFRMYAALRGK